MGQNCELGNLLLTCILYIHVLLYMYICVSHLTIMYAHKLIGKTLFYGNIE